MLAAELVTRLGRDLIVPGAVIVEVDQLLRSRVGGHAARLFLAALAAGEHLVAFSSAALLRRAAEIDARFADRGRAARPVKGYWRLIIDESRYARATGER